MTEITRYVGLWAAKTRLSDVPESVVQLAKRSILDGLGLAVAGSSAEASRIVQRHIADNNSGDGQAGSATVIGAWLRTSPRFAALANGVAIHADDFDDTQLAVGPDRIYGLLTHPTAPVLPVALAVAESRHLPGSEVLRSYLIGVEVATKLAESIAPEHYQRGFHTTGTVGTLGAAAAAIAGLGLDERSATMALGIAASSAAGLRENFGTMTKPLHAGHAAERGLVAADLASNGFTAAADALEGPRGFFGAAGGGFDLAVIEQRLGHPWTFDQPGVSIKPHPSGSLTHPAMAAMSELIREHRLTPQSVAKVEVRTNSHMPTALIHNRPTTELEAKFSMEFSMAVLLVKGKASLHEYTNEIVNSDEIQDVLRSVAFISDASLDAVGLHTMASVVRVHTNNGSVLEKRVDHAKGSPYNQMTNEELISKVSDCLRWSGLSGTAAVALAERVMGLEEASGTDWLLEPLKNPAD